LANYHSLHINHASGKGQSDEPTFLILCWWSCFPYYEVWKCMPCCWAIACSVS